jgi:hypothetical protein
MATFTASPLVGQVSGRIGGVEFLSGRSSGIIKAARRNRKTLSSPQTQAIAFASIFKHAWDSAPQNYRDAWVTFAASHPVKDRFQRLHSQSGLQACFTLHSQMWDAFNRIFYEAPHIFPPPALSDLTPPIRAITPNFVAGAGYWLYTYALHGSSSRQFLYAARRGGGARGGGTNMRFIGAVVWDGTPVDWMPFFHAAGLDWILQPGEQILIRVQTLGYITTVNWPNLPWTAQIPVL